LFRRAALLNKNTDYVFVMIVEDVDANAIKDPAFAPYIDKMFVTRGLIINKKELAAGTNHGIYEAFRALNHDVNYEKNPEGQVHYVPSLLDMENNVNVKALKTGFDEYGA
jgi:GH25 family lysozyme M1 (1,4-beta-N-acetylmuramidase)